MSASNPHQHTTNCCASAAALAAALAAAVAAAAAVVVAAAGPGEAVAWRPLASPLGGHSSCCPD